MRVSMSRTYGNFLRLSPLTFLALVDMNLTSQLVSGMIGFHRPDLIVVNGLFSIAGLGAWAAAMTLEGSRIERLITLVACFLVDLPGIAFSVLIAFALTGLLSDEYLAVIRIGGALSVFSIGLLTMGVRLPLGKKLPWLLVTAGVTMAVVKSFLESRLLGAATTMIDVTWSAAALFLIVIIGFLSIVPFAWAGEAIARHIELSILRSTAGLVIIGISTLIAGLGFNPVYIGLGGLLASILLKHQNGNSNRG